MTILDYCRLFVIISWGWLLVLRFNDLGRMLFAPHKASHYDVLWALQAVTAFVVIAFCARPYVAQSSQEAYVALYLISALLALSHIRVVYKFKQNIELISQESVS